MEKTNAQILRDVLGLKDNTMYREFQEGMWNGITWYIKDEKVYYIGDSEGSQEATDTDIDILLSQIDDHTIELVEKQ